jgi:hypothetical protein
MRAEEDNFNTWYVGKGIQLAITHGNQPATSAARNSYGNIIKEDH